MSDNKSVMNNDLKLCDWETYSRRTSRTDRFTIPSVYSSNSAHNLSLLPKVELHLHLEGALRLSTIIDLCHQLQIKVPGVGGEKDPISAYLDFFCITEPVKDLPAFIEKIWQTQSLLASNEIVQRIAREVVQDAYAQGVKLLEIRYSPQFIHVSKYIDHSHMTLESIHTAVLMGIEQGVEDCGGDIACGVIGKNLVKIFTDSCNDF